MTESHRSPSAAAARIRLVCFPHAGGTPAFFRRWSRILPDRFDVEAVCYPGRDHRWRESVPSTAAGLVDDAVEHLTADDRPFALFGHSMGAGVAYEVALRLEERGRRPLRVIVSAFRPPHERTPVGVPDTDEGLMALLSRYGSRTMTALDSAELAAVLLPTLRADMRLADAYRRAEPVPVDAPITTCCGRDDDECSDEQMRTWDACTRRRVEHHTFTGGHFYLESHEHELLRTLAGQLIDDEQFARATRHPAVATRGTAAADV